MDEKTREELEKLDAAAKDTGKEPAEKPAAADDESLSLPETEMPAIPDADKKPAEGVPEDGDDKPAPSESKPESEPKPDSVAEPESKPDNE